MAVKTTIQKTPLHSLHQELGAKFVDFSGWQMPIQYPAGIVKEHLHCRNAAALFDVSHMGQFLLRGELAGPVLEAVSPSDLQNLAYGKACYTVFTNAQGGIIDDLIVSRLAPDCYSLVVNASRRDTDYALLQNVLAHSPHSDGVELSVLDNHALLALQGPSAAQILSSFYPAVMDMRFMEVLSAEIMGTPCCISRTGYTGEDGFEISIPAEIAVEFSRQLLSHDECCPAGLGARDSLRLEAGLPLYGQDLDENTTPIDAALRWIIPKRRRAEGGFPGFERISAELQQGTKEKLVAIAPEGRAPIRRGVRIVSADGQDLGSITSGIFSPTLGKPIAMGYVLAEYSQYGTELVLLLRGRPVPAQITRFPFVGHNYKR